jgi:hypothetical protein
MIKYANIVFTVSALMLTACGSGADTNEGRSHKGAADSASADIVIDGAAHHFTKVECFKGFNDDLMVVLKNNEMYLEVSQLQPEQNTWTIKYHRGSFASGGNFLQQIDQADEYFTRTYDVIRDGNKMIGTATSERGKLPRNPVDISINVACQKMK